MTSRKWRTPQEGTSYASLPAWRRFLTDFRSVLREGKSVLKESSSALLLSVAADLTVGIALVGFASLLLDFPGTLIMVPGALAARGNVYATLASRLSTALHLGEVEPSLRMNRWLRENIRVSLVQTLTISAALAVFARAAALLLDLPSLSLLELLFISLVGTIISAAVLLGGTSLITLGSFRRGWDPDNISSPLITTIGDFITLPSMVAAVYLLIHLRGTLAHGVAVVLGLSVLFLLLDTLRRRGSSAEEVLSQSLHVLLVCALISIVTGTLLSARAESLIGYSIFLLLLPLLNGQSGNLGSILSSRLSTAYYLGLTSLKRRMDRFSRREAALIILLSFIVFPLAGVIALSLSTIYPLTHPGIPLTAALIVLIGFLLGVEASLLSYNLSHMAVRFSLNPDNVVIPLLTTLMDLAVMGTLLVTLAVAGLI